MICFFTSSPTGPLDGSRPVFGFDDWNCFRENLARYWPDHAKVLMISASPDAYQENDRMIDFFRDATTASGYTVSRFDLMDRRYVFSCDEIREYDVIILGGGHTPTQCRYFQEISLRQALTDFSGIVIGISAGSMNCADTVYFQPELPGEAVDPQFQRYATGLGLTQHQILPHYQMVRDMLYDGLSYAEANFPYSHNHSFLALCDGSYLMQEDGVESVWGEAYLIQDGTLHTLCTHDRHVNLESNPEGSAYA